MRDAPGRLYRSLKDWIAENTPPGTRVVIHRDSNLVIQLACDGRNPKYGHHCCKAPGHKGPCLSARDKTLNFTPTEGGPDRRGPRHQLPEDLGLDGGTDAT